MNILNVIDKNLFLKKLYPNGLFNFYIGRIELNTFNTLTMVFHLREKPAIDIAKWGKWGKEYNVITAELIGSDIKKIQINNWQNNNQEVCNCKIDKATDDYISLTFSGCDWSVELILKSLILQRNTTYLENNKEER